MGSDDPGERRRLESAMGALCVERGYAGVDRPALLERAGMGEGAFARVFADVEDCFCALVQSGTDELLVRAGIAFAAHEGWRTQLRATAWEMLEFLLEDPGRTWAMMIESPTACERSREIRENGMAALAALIDLARAELPSEDAARIPASTAEVTAGAVYNHIHAAVVDGSLPEQGETRVRELMYTAVRPYFGPDAALEELDAPRP